MPVWVPRIRSRASSMLAGSLSRSPSETSSSTDDMMPSTLDTSARADCIGACGISAIVAKATRQPMIASTVRSIPVTSAPGGMIVAIRIAPIAAWLFTRIELEKNDAISSEPATITAICQPPSPSR